jgi:hypothetical protein
MASEGRMGHMKMKCIFDTAKIFSYGQRLLR